MKIPGRVTAPGFFVVKNVSRQKKKNMHFKDQSNKAGDAGRASMRP
jgi:hypothetical protein